MNNIWETFKITENVVTDNNEVLSENANVLTLANAFLSIESMTHKKLQKLCYYAKAWYLAIYSDNIIEDPFEAWVHGAVQPLLYQVYRSYGFELIPMYTGDKNLIPEEFISFAQEVFQAYGHLTGDDLERLNHCEEPWLNARKGLNPWENSNSIISEIDMQNFYRKKLEK